MRCLKCGAIDDKVIDSRAAKDGYSIRRRRECLDCGFRFTTYEQVERNDLRVIKRSGVREKFEREKVLNGLLKACEKRPVSIEVLQNAADEIVMDLQSDGLLEIPYRNIGARVMEKLREIDQVAFVRYASVYRQFQDVGEFLEEIESLGRNPLKDLLQPDLFGTGSS